MGNYILIIGAEPYLRTLLYDVFKEERGDDTIEMASSVQETLIAIARRPADMIIIDSSRSAIDGLTLIECIQACYPETSASLITAADGDEIDERSNDWAASFTLFTKPFSIDKLLQHVDCVLAQKAQYQSPRQSSFVLNLLSSFS